MNYPHPITRRIFLRETGMALTLFNILPGRLPGADAVTPGQKLNVAGVGVGSRGGTDVSEVAALGHNIVALCDVDENTAVKTFGKFPAAKRFTDYRVMFDQMGGTIEAVVIGTPDHNHAIVAMEAMRRGKHVFCEKPLAHSVYEVRELMKAAEKYKVVTQLGNQGHSSDSIRRVCEWIWLGVIGQVHTIHAATGAFKDVYSQMRNLGKLTGTEEVPKGLNYDLWLGPAEFRPYSKFWIPWNWRGWLPFGGGAIGDWICHVVDPAFWALDLGAPATVMAEVTDYDVTKHGLTYPPAAKFVFEFPARKGRGPVKLVWYDGLNAIPRPKTFGPEDKIPGTGAIIYGDKGMIVHGSHGGGGCVLYPEGLMEQHSGANAPAERIPRVKGHPWDWAEAIRTGRQAGSHFGYGGPLSQLGLLGLIALHFPGQTLSWDDAAMRFINLEAANAFVNPPYRKGWTL